MNDYITTQEAARVLGLHINTVNRFGRLGRLERKSNEGRDGAWLYSRASVEALKASRVRTPPADFVTIEQAAEILQVHWATVAKWARTGKLRARQVQTSGGRGRPRWFVSERAARELAASRETNAS